MLHEKVKSLDKLVSLYLEKEDGDPLITCKGLVKVLRNAKSDILRSNFGEDDSIDKIFAYLLSWCAMVLKQWKKPTHTPDKRSTVTVSKLVPDV